MNSAPEQPKAPRRALILSIGYGEGHHAVARAAAEEFARRGWVVQCSSPCEETHPRLFRVTQRFYHLCVRRAPWLWGVTYAQTDTADWAAAVRRPILRDCCRHLAELLRAYAPDVIICTYPLFAYMVDALREDGEKLPPCVVVVTDALEISRPWMLSRASLICLPDDTSARLVQERYALPQERLAVSGLPVRAEFRRARRRTLPSPENLHLVYGAFAPLGRVVDDVRGLLSRFPAAHITLLAGERASCLARLLPAEMAAGRVALHARVDDMPALFARSHLYIGKAGAATLFEAYSSCLPCIVNYSLPGQEQGNLELLLSDGAGLCVADSAELLSCVSALLQNNARGWSQLADAMRRAGRHHGAERLAELIEVRFFCASAPHAEGMPQATPMKQNDNF